MSDQVSNISAGQASPSKSVKSRHSKADPKGKMRLKTFVRSLIKEGDEMAKQWVANKRSKVSGKK